LILVTSHFNSLSDAVRAQLDASEKALRQNDHNAALQFATSASHLAPDHPDTLRQMAAVLCARGPSAEALGLIDRAVAARPGDPGLLTTRAIVLEVNGKRDEAVAAFRQASAAAPGSVALMYNLGRALSKYASAEESLKTLDRALALEPNHRGARATKAEVLRQLGRTEETIAEYRQLLAREPTDIRVWSAMAALNRARFTDEEIATLERIDRNPSLGVEARTRIAFTLGKVHEERERYAEAYSAFARGNAIARSQIPWSAPAFSAQVDSILKAFNAPPDRVSETRGEGLIFIVSLPRSGSTLTEQILAAHPSVDAGDERMDLFDVLAAEGQRREQPLARWAPTATQDDWRRLGDDYLARSARWRSGRPFATDKMPANWLWLGAALAMLPGARVVECRRDVLETAWSCFCHLFAGGAQEFSYDFASIAAYADDYERAMRQWRTFHPSRIRTQIYEDLVANTEPQVHELLAFCGLEFDAACLRFYDAQRSVRTASASQVREPLRKNTARTAKYGALLDPLRTALGLPLFTG
jgi:tetratricopeptide (TPR) repeat protein